jgi:hypothetical protein
MKREPMNYLAFRKAVSHTIDKETIVERYMGGYGQAGDSSEPPFWTDWYNSSVNIYPFDINLAKQELTAGGFTGVGTQLRMPDGRPVPSIVLLTPPADYDPVRIKAGELIAKNLRSLGMDIVAKPVDFDTLVAKMNAFDYDMLIIGWSLSSDPVGNVFDILGPMASQNYFAWWPVDHAYENPWYNELYGISTLADAESQAMAIKTHELGQMAKETFDRDEQIFYTKWAQGIVSDALPCNVLYYRVNNYAINTKWDGWIPYFGELLNVYSLGALSSEVVAPTVGAVNAILNIPEKLPLGMETPATVVVFDGDGFPLPGATVSVTSPSGVTFNPASGVTDDGGVFHFMAEGTKHSYVTVDVDVDSAGTAAEVSRIVSVTAGTPPIAFLYVTPADLFLLPGESTDVDMWLLDSAGVGILGHNIELDVGLMGYGSVDTPTVMTDADGYGKIVYTAPATFPMNKHIEVRLSLSAEIAGDYSVSNINTVTQFLVLYNEDPSTWQFIQITDVSKVACNATNDTTNITVMVTDENGDPMADEPISADFSNDMAIEAKDDMVTTNATGHAMFMVDWDETADTNATQVFFTNEGRTLSVGAGASLLFKGATDMDLYGGYFTISELPMLAPDSGLDLTWDVYVKDLDDMDADVPVSFIVGEPSDGSTAAMVDPPDYLWTSLWDYAGINIFTDADDGVMAAAGYFLSDKMTDEEMAAIPNNLYDTWEFFFDDWLGGPVQELEDMSAVMIEGGHWQVQIERDSVALSDNVPQLIIIPNGKAGFYCTPDYANYWWQINGDTAWKTEFVMQKTNTITSVAAEFSTGVLRDFAPGNVATVDLWAYDQNGDPIPDIDIDAWVQVYGGVPFFDIEAGAVTDVTGMTSATMTGLSEDASSNPLSNPSKQPMYLQAVPDYGWNVFTSVEIFNVPVQLYITVEASPIIQAEGETGAESEITITVIDEYGDPQVGFMVEFTHQGGSLSAMSVVTDALGEGVVTYTLPEILQDEEFSVGVVASSVAEIGFGAASAAHAVVAFTPIVLYPPEIAITAPVDGSESDATTVQVSGTVTDVQGIKEITVKMDEGNLMLGVIDGETWSYTYSDVTIGAHTVVVVVYNIHDLSDTDTVSWTTTEPPEENLPPVIANVLPAPGTKIDEVEAGTSMVVTCDVTDDHGIATVKVRVNDGEWKTMVLGTGDTYAYTFTTLAVGTYDVDIEATDSHGLTDTDVTDFEVEEVVVIPPDDDDDDDETDYTWVYIAIAVIVIVLILVVVMMSRGGGGAPAPEPEAEEEPEAEPEEEPEPEAEPEEELEES